MRRTTQLPFSIPYRLAVSEDNKVYTTCQSGWIGFIGHFYRFQLEYLKISRSYLVGVIAVTCFWGRGAHIQDIDTFEKKAELMLPLPLTECEAV